MFIFDIQLALKRHFRPIGLILCFSTYGCQHLYLSTYLSTYLSIYQSIYLSIYLTIYLYIYLLVYLYVCVCIKTTPTVKINVCPKMFRNEILKCYGNRTLKFSFLKVTKLKARKIYMYLL